MTDLTSAAADGRGYPEIAALAYEDTERGEAVASFAYRFHGWEPDDQRWGYLASLWSLLDIAANIDHVGQPVSRPTRLAQAVLEMIEGVAELISRDDRTDMAYVGMIVRSAKIVDLETHALLCEAGARRAESIR